MATFRDLVNKLEQGKVHKLTWLCGSQPVLTEEAITAIRLTLNAEEMNTTTLFAEAKKPNAEIWTELSQHAIDPTMPRLVVVRDAEKLGKSLAKLEPWLAGAKYAQVHAVMASNLEEWSPDFMPDVRKKVVGSASSLYVELKLSKAAGDAKDPRDTAGRPYTKAEQQAAQIAADFWSPNLSRELALLLARRTNCDLARVRDVCMWVNSLTKTNPSWKVTPGVINTLATESPTEGFADALTKLDKPKAMEIALTLEGQEKRMALFRLQRNLSNLEAMNRAMKPVLQKHGGDRSKIPTAIRETATAANVPVQEAQRLWDTAKHYDATTVSRRTEALIRADAHRNELGVLETLVTEW